MTPIEDLIPMLWKLAKKIRTHGAVGPEDLVQAAAIALMRARETFDPTLGFNWIVYAKRRAFGAMIDHLRNMDHVPRLERIRLKAAGKEGRRIFSLDTRAIEISMHEGGIPPASTPGVDDQIGRRDFWTLVRARLPRRAGLIVEKYFRGGQKLKAIGEDLGLSESRICQMLATALKQLRRRGGLEAS